MTKKVNVSIVIPVYNEEAILPACLEAIAKQTVRPKEVIVVDNNSTDNSVLIAKRFPFVKVIHEKRQGVIFARDTGFNAVRGDVIGRIDADTLLAPNWVEMVQHIMSDSSVDAVTGRVTYHDIAWGPLMNYIDLGIRSYLARVLGDEVAMQGANMAMRRRTWLIVRNAVCRTGGMHEDLDLTVHTTASGYRVIFDKSMVVSLGYRQLESSYKKFSHYVMLTPKTYAIHGLHSQRHMYPFCYLALACFLPLKILHRGYDRDTATFSWAKAMGAGENRVNPATFVDY